MGHAGPERTAMCLYRFCTHLSSAAEIKLLILHYSDAVSWPTEPLLYFNTCNKKKTMESLEVSSYL